MFRGGKMFNCVSFAAFVFFSILCSAPLTAEDDWAASPSDVQSSPCRQLNVASSKIMENFLASTLTPALPNETRTFFGLKLTGDPRVLFAIQELLRNEQEIFGKEKFPQVRLSSKCETTDCVLTDSAVFPNKDGRRLLYFYFRYGLKASHYTLPYGQPWKESELDEIERALHDFPDVLFPIHPARPLVRFKEGYTLKLPHQETDSASVLFADESLFFFDPWIAAAAEEKHTTVVHELAHVLDRRTQDHWNWSFSDVWKGLGDWNRQPDGTLKNPLDSKKFVSTYAMTNEAEDFAESVVAYRFKSATLKSNQPEKYAFIRDAVFQGLEFTSPDLCQTKLTYSEQANLWLQSHFSNFVSSLKSDHYYDLMKYCGLETFERMKSPQYERLQEVEVKNCATKAFGNEALAATNIIPSNSEIPRLREFVIQRIPPVQATPEEVQTIHSVIQNQLTFVMQRYLQKTIEENYTLFFSPKSIEELCSAYGKHAYQGADAIGLGKLFGSTDIIFSYRHREFLNTVAKAFCDFAHRNSDKPNKELLNDETIRDYLESIGFAKIIRPISISRAATPSHAHDMVTRINVDHLASNTSR